MNLILILMAVAIVAALVIIVALQAATIIAYKATLQQAIANTERAQQVIVAQGAHIQAQDQRYHLMWDIRRLHEQHIHGLQVACNKMGEYIQRHQQAGQQRPQLPPADPPSATEAYDDADWWKKQD